jgi:hypothetical protein
MARPYKGLVNKQVPQLQHIQNVINLQVVCTVLKVKQLFIAVSMATKECFSFFVCINDDVMKQ